MRPLILAGLLAAAAPLQRAPAAAVSAEAIRRHVFVLGSDAFEGRAAGTAGAERAARYIADEIARYGLRPLGPDGSYFQDVPLHASRPDDANELFLVSECGSGPLRPGDDYLLEAVSEGSLLPQPVGIVFAGYGIVAPEYDYNDYQDLDVAGKVVAVLAGEPLSDDPRYFAGERPTVYGTFEAKQRLALSRGARGTLLLPSALEPSWKSWQYWRPQYGGESVSLGYSTPHHLAARVHPDVAKRLLCGSGVDLQALHRMEKEHRLRSFPLAAQVRYRGSFHERDFVSANVVGAVPGNDPELRGSWVLVSAHYDHLGVGPAEGGDAIYNGVIDNAIGVAAALEIARVLATRPPRRSVAFVFTTAEESGLLGATHYVEHPLLPLSRTVANLNVDGLAHLDAFSDVIGVGAELSSLGRTLEKVAARHGMSVGEPPAVLASSDAFTCSDQLAFAEGGVPALLVNEGFRGGRLSPAAALARYVEWGRTRYHRPSDDLDQPLDFEASRLHARLLVDFVIDVADSDEVPSWRAGSHHAAAQARARAERQ